MKPIAAALLSVARAIGRLAARGPVSHLCCTDDGRLVAVIWGRIFWRKLNEDWLAGDWAPLALPGEEEHPATTRHSSSTETAAVKPSRRPRRR